MTDHQHRLRALVNVLNLSTPAGWALARLAAQPPRRIRARLWLAHGYRWPVPRVAAFTVGDMILLSGPSPPPGVDPMGAVDRRLLDHEQRHASQYAWCGGVLMLGCYAGAALWSWVRTGDVASRNIFERRAGLLDGGYVEQPVRSWQTRHGT